MRNRRVQRETCGSVSLLITRHAARQISWSWLPSMSSCVGRCEYRAPTSPISGLRQNRCPSLEHKHRGPQGVRPRSWPQTVSAHSRNRVPGPPDTNLSHGHASAGTSYAGKERLRLVVQNRRIAVTLPAIGRFVRPPDSSRAGAPSPFAIRRPECEGPAAGFSVLSQEINVNA